MLTLNELSADAADGSIDTIVVGFTDMQGRLLGKRLDAEYFLDSGAAEHRVEGCNYLLAIARTEQRLFDEVVTDYEIARMFERG